MTKKPVSQIVPKKNGIQFVSFSIQDRSKFGLNQRIWFEFHYKNLLGKTIRYGSMGTAVHKWQDDEWVLHAYKHSYGGPNGRFPKTGRDHEDNWKADLEGTFALTPYVSFDKGAKDKIKSENKPHAVADVFHMGQPIYVKIGPSGGIIDSPPTPLVSDKEIPDSPEVPAPKPVDPADGADAQKESRKETGEIGSEDESGAGLNDELADSVGNKTSGGKSSLPPLVLRSSTGEISRQVIEWAPGSGVDAVRIDMSRRHSGRWLTHTSLTEALDTNNRLEIIFLDSAAEGKPTTLRIEAKKTEGQPSKSDLEIDDETKSKEQKATRAIEEEVGTEDPNPLDTLPLRVPSTYLLDVEFVSQSGNKLRKDCGPACIAMLAENSLEMALEQSGGKENEALTRQQLITALEANKINSKKVAGLTPEQVRNQVKQNRPVILLINYGQLPKSLRQISVSNFDHFVVAAGADETGIYLHDPLGTGSPGGYYTYLTDAELDKAMSKMAWNNDPRLGILIDKAYDRLFSEKLTSGYVHNDFVAIKGGLAITKGRPNMRWAPIESDDTIMIKGLARTKLLLVLDGETKNGYLPIRTVVGEVKPRPIKRGHIAPVEAKDKKAGAGKLQTGMNINPDASHGNPMDTEALKGLDWVRFPFKLAAREKESERDDINKAFAQYDVVVSNYAAQGINSLIVLNQETVGGRVPWQLKDGDKITHPYSDEIEEWEEYAARFATTAAQITAHYRDKGFGAIIAYQIWNEGDLKNNPASAYLKPEHMAIILGQAAKAIRKEDPEATLVFNGMATGAGTAVKYIKKVQATLGNKLPVDALGVHPYGQYITTPPFDGWGHGFLKDYLKIYRQQFPDIPVWITEIGVAENNPLGPEHYQAISRYLKDIFTYVAQQQSDQVEVLIWFAWSDEMRNAGMVDRQGKVKKHVHAVFEQVRDRKII